MFLILGICTQFFTQFWSFSFLVTFVFLGLLAILIFSVTNKFLRTIITFILFFFIGVSSVYINDDRNYDSFYQSYFKENSTVVLQIDKILKPGNYYQKYEAKVINVDNKVTKGKVLLNIKKDSVTSSILTVDNQIILKPNLRELIPPLNPHQFDYKFYLEKQGVYHQLFTESNHFFKLDSKPITLLGFASKIRDKIQESLKKHHFKENEFAVINALLLGQRQDISKDLLVDYQRAGAIHILAVSGLHIGIILLILSFLLKPLEKINHGKVVKTIMIILLLWLFAFVAGLSASIVRAVTMFTFLAVGLSFRRKKIIEFSFITSMFFLLIVKPMFLFDVGFQLSYLAVFGILWIQPKFYKIYNPRFFLDKKIWELFSVSIAAQIAILPLSIYYFQQFPGLFLASNLVIIPFLGAILIGGFFVIIFSLLNFLPQLVADCYGVIISLMNSFVSWVSLQEEFLFKEISISFIMMLVLYVFIFLGVNFAIEKSVKKLIYFMTSILLLQSVYLFEKNQKKSKKELIVFHKSRYSVIGKRAGEKLFLQHNLDDLQMMKENSISSYRIAEGINQLEEFSFKNYISFSNKNILLVDSLGVYNVSSIKKPIVILQYSPKINLTRLIKTIKPSQIIADGSNYKSNVTYWKNICKELKTPFYYTGQNGAYFLKD
ncbi:ComEC/Rec2 family competence protein [Polaribacter sp. Asnod1-A03]|uniref:ComEC/Rec2 family competence protein n=1 Tax=Polaribacter sp. Asnod1-A03 TaxID=3160581 RepID=UPI0038692C75